MLKVAVALFISVMLHVLMIQAVIWYLELTPKVRYRSSFANIDMVLAIPQAQAVAQPPNNDKAIISHDTENAQVINEAKQKKRGHDANVVFYSNQEVDRKALPQSTIDELALNAIPYSGLPISLRLFINMAGRLVKIERIGVLAQDDLFVSTLEQLLFKTVFLPARRDRMDVNSYQDVQFSFEQSAHAIKHDQ
ncbi:MAG: hypothetical protein KFB94_06290 [Methylophilaceae bacterium]|nr:MAG: hypothetical protein KFB94_06290 [Methylophilaceae bacterium]